MLVVVINRNGTIEGIWLGQGSSFMACRLPDRVHLTLLPANGREHFVRVSPKDYYRFVHAFWQAVRQNVPLLVELKELTD